MSLPSTSLIVYGTSWCGDCRRARRWLNEHHIPFDDVDIDLNPDAAALVTQVNRGSRSVPTIVFPDGTILVEPSNEQLARQVQREFGTAFE